MLWEFLSCIFQKKKFIAISIAPIEIDSIFWNCQKLKFNKQSVDNLVGNFDDSHQNSSNRLDYKLNVLHVHFVALGK
jgi:hypothetical protein